MKTNEWLYGKDVEVPCIPKEVANKRLELLQVSLEETLEVAYTERDNLRINAIMKARKFWIALRDGNTI